MMGQQQAVPGPKMIREGLVAGGTGRIFQTGLLRDRDPLDGQGDLPRSAFALTMRRPAVSLGMQAVMDVNSVDGGESLGPADLHQRVEQRHRVQTTGQPQPPDRGLHAGRQLCEQRLRGEHPYLIPKAIRRS